MILVPKSLNSCKINYWKTIFLQPRKSLLIEMVMDEVTSRSSKSAEPGRWMFKWRDDRWFQEFPWSHFPGIQKCSAAVPLNVCNHGAGCFSSGVSWWQFSCHLGGFLGGFPLLSGHQDVDFTTATPHDIIPEDSKLTMFGGCTLVWIYFVFVELQQKMTSIEQFPTKTGWFHLKGLISLERNLVNQLTSIR